MRSRHDGRALLALLLLLTSSSAAAEGDAAASAGAPTVTRPWLRLEIAPSLAVHSDTESTSLFEARTTGETLAHLRLLAEALPWKLPLGVGFRIDMERATLDGSGPFGAFSLGATSFSAAGGLAARLVSWRGLEGRLLLGYGLEQQPLLWLASGATAVEVASVRAHGPLLALAGRAPLGRRFAIELRGFAVPVTFGGAAGGLELSMGRMGGGIALAVRGAGSRWRWAGLLGYDLERTAISGTGLEMTSWKNLVSLGLELDRTRPQPAAQDVAPTPVPTVGRIRGFVRAASGGAVMGLPIAGAVVHVAGRPEVQSGRDGSFVIEGVPAGAASLTVRAVGWKTLDEVISVPAGGEATLELALSPSHAPDFATIRGVVRSSVDGSPLAALVTVPQLDIRLTAAADGSFVVLAAPGTLTVSIAAPGFEEQTKTLTVGRGEQAILNVDLQPRP